MSFAPSPLVGIYDALRPISTRWSAEVGRPSGAGWIAGTDLRSASRGPLHELLLRTGEQLGTADRKTTAAMFALRFGASAAMAIAPYIKYGCVPDISLENVSLRFTESARFERTAIHEPLGSLIAGDGTPRHPAITPVTSPRDLVRLLRDRLSQQAAPVVQAVHDWSGFSQRAAWGLIASSWVEQFTSIGANPTDQRNILPILDELFDGDDVVASMRPTFLPTSHCGVTHLCQQRASCCRYYLLPQKTLCTSCPLVPRDERPSRNLRRIERHIERTSEHGALHGSIS